MDLWQKIKDLFGGSGSEGFTTEASLDLDVLHAHDHASKLTVAVDLVRLERKNKERRAAAHLAVGDLHVEAGNLKWMPHRLERTCGVRNIEFTKDQLRSIERTPGAVVAVLRDGTNVPFVVSTQATPSRRLGIPKPGRARGQEPPLIS
jgi:hypothetical protein